MPINWPRKGEVAMKDWRKMMAKRLGTTESYIANRLSDGALPYPPVRRVNARVVFVIVDEQAANDPANALMDLPRPIRRGRVPFRPKADRPKPRPKRETNGHLPPTEAAWREFLAAMDKPSQDEQLC